MTVAHASQLAEVAAKLQFLVVQLELVAKEQKKSE